MRQTYNDGVCDIYLTELASKPGKLPEYKNVLRERLRYANRTVGAVRFYTAMQTDTRIDCMIRVQRRKDIRRSDVVVVNGIQYGIKQIQYPADVVPESMDLSLMRIEAKDGRSINPGPV